jgi:hypothetical protein
VADVVLGAARIVTRGMVDARHELAMAPARDLLPEQGLCGSAGGP